MTTQQLTLDVFAAARIRPRGRITHAAHQRGYVRLPYTTAGGAKVGSIVPAWVCCRCGGVEIATYVFNINHGCCVFVNPSCCIERPGRPGGRRTGPFDAHWIPDRPR